MNIKCFSDLEKWMQGVVDQAVVATGTTGAVCLRLESWGYTTGDKASGGQLWVSEHVKHYRFETYQELCGVIEKLEAGNHRNKLLYRTF